MDLTLSISAFCFGWESYFRFREIIISLVFPGFNRKLLLAAQLEIWSNSSGISSRRLDRTIRYVSSQNIVGATMILWLCTQCRKQAFSCEISQTEYLVTGQSLPPIITPRTIAGQAPPGQYNNPQCILLHTVNTLDTCSLVYTALMKIMFNELN